MLSGVERTREIDVTPEVYKQWEQGEGLIQTLMPHLSAADREFIMTGSSSEEWDETFKDDTE
jgi:hypothetical protein